MNVPLLDLRAQYSTIKREAEAAILHIAESQQLILGEEVQDLENALAEYCGSRFAIGVSSGTDALLMALTALNIGPGDEVVMPTYSFFATAGTVARLGAKPVLTDIDPITWNITAEHIERAITPQVKAIIPVHLYGQTADMRPVLEVAAHHNIPVIEDAAQSIGAQYHDGRIAGSMGLMGCYSFYPTKNLGAFGDAGLVVTNDEELAVRLRQMREHGAEQRYYHKFVGGNFRIDAIQAAVLNVKLPHLETWHEARRRNADLYAQAFMDCGLSEGKGIAKFDEKNPVLLPLASWRSSGVKNYHIYNQYIVRVQQRDELRDFLASRGIGSQVYYPAPFHRQECFAYLDAKDADFPMANEAAATTLALPIYPELSPEQIKYVAQTFAEFICPQ
ncbi:DegT/DnrJ/EryC1/StrS family aminotransferase [Ignavibacteria bacterium]|nr:DegT/DnrJ/EryC1/StrS family aminotransferase [Bacteroidota bacterium]MCZ2132807.1 DegT/DnrJ/EryC1/StrS family aminotransferase [Bacteroidota bacterium]